MPRLFPAALLLLLAACADQPAAETSLMVVFDEATTASLDTHERESITAILAESESEARELLPTLPDTILVTVVVIDRNVDVVGGVTGRADAPGSVIVELSSVYPGGAMAAAETALASTAFHEFHHLSRGWTIEGNRFGPGIPTAAVNEGLASVFSEEYTGVYFPDAYAYPDEAADWLAEIQTLPLDADYATWMMNEHPDGRNSIGYRVGRYIVHQASERSGLDVLELSKLEPDEILGLAAPSR